MQLRNYAIQRQDLLEKNLRIPAIREGKGEEVDIVIYQSTPYESIEDADEYNVRVFFSDGSYRVNSIDLEYLNDKVLIDYTGKNLHLRFQGEEFVFDLEQGDLGDFWQGFKLSDGTELDLNFYQDDRDEKPAVSIYGVVDGRIDFADSVSIVEVSTDGDIDNYFGPSIKEVAEEPFSFEGVAKDLKNGETGFWTDGIIIKGDNERHSAFMLVSGKKYKVTIEEL